MEINALGVANGTSHEVEEKWKNLKSSAKKSFRIYEDRSAKLELVCRRKSPRWYKKKL